MSKRVIRENYQFQPWTDEVETARQEFVLRFVDVAQNLMTHVDVDFSIKQKILTYVTGSIMAGLLLTIPCGQPFIPSAFKVTKAVVEASAKENNKIDADRKILKVDKKLNTLTSSHRQDDHVTGLRILFVNLGLQIFHNFEYQFQNVCRKLSSKSYDRLQAIKILGHYAGAHCFMKFAKNSSPLSSASSWKMNNESIYEFLLGIDDDDDDVFLKSTKFFDILKSLYGSWTVDKLYFMEEGETKFKFTDTRQFFRMGVPGFSLEKESVIRPPTDSTHNVFPYVWFKSDNFDEQKKTGVRDQVRFMSSRLRRPFKFEWRHYLQSPQPTQKYDALDHRDYFWEDQSHLASDMYQKLLPRLQDNQEQILTEFTKLRLQFLDIRDHTSQECEGVIAAVNEKLVEEGSRTRHHISSLVCSDLIGSPVTSLPPCELCPDLFTGRTEFFLKLDRLITESGMGCTVLERMTVISGLGGIGKSSAVLKYFSELKKKKSPSNKKINVAWLNADSGDSIKNSFTALGHHLKILGDDQSLSGNEEEVTKLVQKIYRHFNDHVKTGYFVFDNAHQMRSQGGVVGIQIFFPKEDLPNLPLFLVTSRNKVWGLLGNQIHQIELDVLDKMEALQFLTKALLVFPATPSDEEKTKYEQLVEGPMDKLVETLGCFPLALNLAAAAISESVQGLGGIFGCHVINRFDILATQIDDYLEEFHNHGEKWIGYELAGDFLDRYDQIMATVWQSTIQRIEAQQTELSRIALSLLNIVSYLPTDEVSLEFCQFVYNLTCGGENFGSDELTKISADYGSKVRRAFSILEKYSMLSVQTRKKFLCYSLDCRSLYTQWNICVHRLVQKSTRVNLRLANDWTALLQILHFLEVNKSFIDFHGIVLPVLDYVQKHRFVQNSYRPFVHISWGMGRDLEGRIRSVYEFLRETSNKIDDPEYFDLCKLILILTTQDIFDDIVGGGGVNASEIILDNSQTFHFSDPWRKLKLTKYFGMVLEHSIKHRDNWTAQQLAAKILGRQCDIFYNSGTLVMTKDISDPFEVDWLRQYFTFVQTNKEKLSVHMADVMTGIVKISVKFLLRKEVAEIGAKILLCRLKVEDGFDPMTFLLCLLQTLDVQPPSDRDQYFYDASAPDSRYKTGVSSWAHFVQNDGLEGLTQVLEKVSNELRAGKDTFFLRRHLQQFYRYFLVATDSTVCIQMMLASKKFMTVFNELTYLVTKMGEVQQCRLYNEILGAGSVVSKQLAGPFPAFLDEARPTFSVKLGPDGGSGTPANPQTAGPAHGDDTSLLAVVCWMSLFTNSDTVGHYRPAQFLWKGINSHLECSIFNSLSFIQKIKNVLLNFTANYDEETAGVSHQLARKMLDKFQADFDTVENMIRKDTPYPSPSTSPERMESPTSTADGDDIQFGELGVDDVDHMHNMVDVIYTILCILVHIIGRGYIIFMNY